MSPRAREGGEPRRPGGEATRLVADQAGAGPVVVLLHGQPGSATDWDLLVDHLTPSFTVLTPDRLGYGRTGGLAGGFAANAAATIELLDRLGIDRALIVGHSLGGGVAIAAAQYHPTRVAGVVLLASVSPGEPIGLLDRVLASHPVGDLAVIATIGGTEQLLRLRGFRQRVLPLLPGSAQIALGTLRGGGTTGSVWRSFAHEQQMYVSGIGALAAGLADIRVPVAVVTGTADRIVAPAVAARLAASIPGAELCRLPGVGHLLAREAPLRVAEVLHRTARRAGL